MKKVLVMGSDGALGTALVKELKRLNKYEIYLASRNPSDESTHRIDIQNKEDLRIIIKEVGPDLLFNMAASFSGDLNEALNINVISVASLLDVVKESAPECRVMLMGSAAEYGAVMPEENPIAEDHTLNPVSIYGLSKCMQLEVAKYFVRQGLDIVICRIFNLEGAGISERLFVGRLQAEINQVLNKSKPYIELGSLSAIRDYIDLDGATLQLLTIASKGKSGEVYNIASGVPISMQELLIKHLSKHGLSLSVVKSDKGLGNHKGYDVPALYADIKKTAYLLELKSESFHGKS